MKYNFDIDMEANNAHTAILKKIKPQSKVLEFGPATGYMTKYMKENLNCSVNAIEIDAEAAKVAENYTEKMIVCDVETLEWIAQLESQKFDFIIFADVLEHLKDPWKVLTEVTSFLKEDGQVLISIPNVSHNAILIELLNGEFKYRKLGLLDNTHLRFFTKSSLLDLVLGSGLFVSDLQKIIIPPEITELASSYQSLPYDVGNFLKQREDGNVYQYVISATKSKPENINTLSEEQKKKEIYVVADYVEVFYDTGKGFNQSESLKLPIKKIGEVEEFLFTLPDSYIKSIRIDPCNSPGIGVISAMELSCKDMDYHEDILYNVQPSNGVKCGKYKDDNSIFFSINKDPQLVYAFSESKYYTGLQLKLTMQFSKVYDENQAEMLNEFSENLQAQTNTLQEKYEKQKHYFETQVEEMEQQISSYNIQMEEMKNQIQVFKEKEQEYKKVKEELEELSNALEFDINELKNSTSWKITAPLRRIRKTLG